MKQLTGFITAVIFLFGLGFFLPDVRSEVKSPLAGKMLADHKNKEKKEGYEKEEKRKMKEEDLEKWEAALKKKEEDLKAWERRLRRQSQIRRSPQTTSNPSVVSPPAPTTSGPFAPGTPAPAGGPQTGRPK